MTFDNDHNRSTKLGNGRRADGGFAWWPLALGAAFVVALVLMFLPARDTPGPRTTDTSPRVERPVTPPASAPAPTTPAPVTPPAPTTPQQ